MTRKSYSIVDLVVLGILIDNPMNAYKLTKLIEQREISKLVRLSTPAVYKSCKRLYENSRLEGTLEQEGEAPEKLVYTVNEEGESYFRTLMDHFARTITPFYFDINSVVFSIEMLDFEEGIKLIDLYESEIKGILSWLKPHFEEKSQDDFANRMIVKQYLMVVEVLVEWVDLLRVEYKKMR